MGANNFRIELSEDVLQSLCEKNIIAENNQPHWGNVNANLSRALGWLTKCDCAILTAWRSGKLRKENDDTAEDSLLRIWRIKGSWMLYGDRKANYKRKQFPRVRQGTWR